jgi:hypothetical protein
MNVAGDWIGSDIRDSDVSVAARTAQRLADVERAQLYLSAFSSPAGRKLLEQWDADIENVRVSVNATLSEYVAAETVRNFVRKVHDQIRLAQTEGR